VRQNPIQRTVSLFICVCIALCTIVAHNIAQNRPDSFPPYIVHKHCSTVYFRNFTPTSNHIYTHQNHLKNNASHKQVGKSGISQKQTRLQKTCHQSGIYSVYYRCANEFTPLQNLQFLNLVYNSRQYFSLY